MRRCFTYSCLIVLPGVLLAGCNDTMPESGGNPLAVRIPSGLDGCTPGNPATDPGHPDFVGLPVEGFDGLALSPPPIPITIELSGVEYSGFVFTDPLLGVPGMDGEYLTWGGNSLLVTPPAGTTRLGFHWGTTDASLAAFLVEVHYVGGGIQVHEVAAASDPEPASGFIGLCGPIESVRVIGHGPGLDNVRVGGDAGPDCILSGRFGPPLGKDRNLGSTLPVKLQLFATAEPDPTSSALSDTLPACLGEGVCPRILVFDEDDPETPLVGIEANVGHPPADDCFRYSDGQWVFNLRLRSGPFEMGHSYRIEVEIGELRLIPENNRFSIRRKPGPGH